MPSIRCSKAVCWNAWGKSQRFPSTAKQPVSLIVNLSVAKIRSEIMLHYLEQFGIYVSSGSACSKGAKSHVLAAFGYPAERIDTALRVSFSPETTIDDIDYFAEKLKEGSTSLMKMK